MTVYMLSFVDYEKDSGPEIMGLYSTFQKAFDAAQHQISTYNLDVDETWNAEEHGMCEIMLKSYAAFVIEPCMVH